MSKYRYDASNAEAHCRGEWTKRGELNNRMYNHCLGIEKAGHANMLHVLTEYGTQEWMATLFPAIWNAWTKRGVTQYQMVGYNLKNEADKFLDFKYEGKQPSYDRSKMNRCVGQWRGDDSRWSMTMYCYKQD